MLFRFLGGKKSKKNSALNARSGVAGDGTDDFSKPLCVKGSD